MANSDNDTFQEDNMPSQADAFWLAGTMTICEHCDGRGGDFHYEGHDLCCECMSEFCSWLLDGGCFTNPDQFSDVFSAPREEHDEHSG